MGVGLGVTVTLGNDGVTPESHSLRLKDDVNWVGTRRDGVPSPSPGRTPCRPIRRRLPTLRLTEVGESRITGDVRVVVPSQEIGCAGKDCKDCGTSKYTSCRGYRGTLRSLVTKSKIGDPGGVPVRPLWDLPFFLCHQRPGKIEKILVT